MARKRRRSIRRIRYVPRKGRSRRRRRGSGDIMGISLRDLGIFGGGLLVAFLIYKLKYAPKKQAAQIAAPKAPAALPPAESVDEAATSGYDYGGVLGSGGLGSLG